MAQGLAPGHLILYRNLKPRRSPGSIVRRLRDSQTGLRKILHASSTGTCKINGPKEKNLLAMKIDPGMKDGGGASRGSITRIYEGVGNPVYLHFEWLLRAALWRHRLLFQRIGSQCPGLG
jgi:hypothetical protein